MRTGMTTGMGMGMGTTMSTDAGALYRLLAWFSPAYPIGAFSYSHGIEMAVESGLVRDRDGLVDWVAFILAHGAGRADAALFVAAHDAAASGDLDALDAVADLAAAWRGTAETALESSQQGQSFLAATRAAWGNPLLDALAARRSGAILAVSVAAGAATAGRAERDLALTAYLHAFAANLVSAGIRLIPLGQTDGQRALAALQPAVEDAVAAALATPLDEVGTAAAMVDWTSMAHETQYTRLYRS